MADLKKTLTFFITIQSDGTNKSAKVSFATDAVSYVPAGLGSGGVLSSLFNTLPADVRISSLTCALGIDASNSSYDSLLHVLTVKFNNTGAAGDLNLMSGTAIYN